MAFLFCDSFDHYTTLTQMRTKWPAPGAISNFNSIQANIGRRGSACHRTNSNNQSKKYLIPTGKTIIFGAACKPTNAGTVWPLMHVMDANSVIHATLRIDAPTGTLQACLSTSTILGTSSAGAFDLNAGYRYLEVKVTIDDSAGVFVVRVDGNTVINLSGVDTRNGGVDGWNLIALGGSGSQVIDWDDMYVLDASGTSHNDFLGDIRVDAHYPDANGANNDSTPSTGTDRSATIDETTPNDDTDYNTITTVGHKDTLSLQSLVNAGATLHAVQASVYGKKTDEGDGSYAVVARQDSIDYDGPSVLANTVYGYAAVQPYGTAPDGTAWTEAKFNAIEIGYKRTA